MATNKLSGEIIYLNAEVRQCYLSEMPTLYGSPEAAGLDLRYIPTDGQPDELTIEPNDVVLVSSGLRIKPDSPLVAGMILPRSGSGHRDGLVLGNLVGLIDPDYEGSLKISCWNRSTKPVTITRGQRIAQFVLFPLFQLDPREVTQFSQRSLRGDGGFGSTGDMAHTGVYENLDPNSDVVPKPTLKRRIMRWVFRVVKGEIGRRTGR